MAAVPQPRRAPSPRSAPAVPRGRGATTRAVARSPGRPDLRVVAPPRHRGRYVLVTVLLVAAAVFGTVSLGALAAESTFTAQQLGDEVDALSLRYDELTAEVARLESPGHVRGVARSELGMVPAEQPGFLVAEPSDPATDADPEVAARGDGPLPAGGVTDRVKQSREGRG